MIDWKSLRVSHDTQAKLIGMVNGMLGEEIGHFVGQGRSLHEAVDDAINEVRFHLQGMGAPEDFLTQFDLQYKHARDELADLYVAEAAYGSEGNAQ